MPFAAQYNDEDFIAVLDKQKLRSAAYVAKRVGCALSTCKAALDKLAASGSIKKLEVDDGATYVYIKEA